jgi:hypothetical protein
MGVNFPVVMFLLGMSFAAAANDSTEGANPIRKIVTLLQNMQKEIEAEGAKEKELFDKFMCFCSSNNGELEKSSADGKAKIEELSAKLKSEEAAKVQTAQELVTHKADRVGAQDDLDKATTLRAKEEAEYAATKADMETNIAAMAGAIPALEKGMGAASLMQLPGSDRLHKLIQSYGNIDDMDRKNTLAFLEQSGDYVPQSGQIVGILKSMKDEMEADLKSAVADEEKSIAGYGDLKASKETEMEVATEAIETKTSRSGELAVSVVQTKDSLEDTTQEVAETDKFIKTLAEQCSTKEAEWAKKSNLRAEEVKAISEAIGILNDDDALDLFKKAVPAALVQESVGFLQKTGGAAKFLRKAQALLATVQVKTPQIRVLLYTVNSKIKQGMHGKTQDLGGVVKMIDDMVVLLGKDQADDDKSKTFCQDEFEKAADEEKAAKEKLASTSAKISELEDSIAQLAEEIESLEGEIKGLDKSVAEATEQRKEEHEDYNTMLQLNEAAIQLLAKAKNRLQKFYNPTLYKAAPVKENTMEEKIIEAGTFVQINAHREADDEAAGFSGGYKKSEKSAGVLGLMDMMAKELESDAKDAGYEEKTSQKDYAELMADSEASRAQDSKSIVDKTASKAELGAKLELAKESKAASEKDVELAAQVIADLHVSCDFLLQNYDLRKEARTNEVESLKNAKAILSGANFGL